MMREVLASHLHELRLPDPAIAYLLTVWDLFQSLDDWVDGDPVTRDEQNRVIWTACMGLGSFHAEHFAALQPVMANAVLKWQASDWIERNGEKEQYAKAYVWRASYYDLVLQVVLLVHGVEVATKLAPMVMRMYGETLSDYLKEFDGA